LCIFLRVSVLAYVLLPSNTEHDHANRSYYLNMQTKHKIKQVSKQTPIIYNRVIATKKTQYAARVSTTKNV